MSSPISVSELTPPPLIFSQLCDALMCVALERWLKFGCSLKERNNKSGYEGFLVASPYGQEISWFTLIRTSCFAPPAPLSILCYPPFLSFRAALLRVESALR